MTKLNTVKFEESHDREKHVINLIIEEYISLEIAGRIRISEDTVNSYRKS
ncbi:MAG: hypothetical protein IPJ26_19460 [Bacteroidetes bacterium]|nr:hypothetical protein [Bacteroidota bacterium]